MAASVETATAQVSIRRGEFVLTASFACTVCGTVVSYSPVEHRYDGRDHAFAEGWFVTRTPSRTDNVTPLWYCPPCSAAQGFKTRKATS